MERFFSGGNRSLWTVMGTLRSVEGLKDAVDPLAVYGEYVRLKVRGAKAMGLCPFHREKTPSFSVNGESGLFYCFGCHKGGDIIQFIQEMESCGFREAVEILARKGGVSFEFEKSGSGRSMKPDTRDRLHALVEAAAVYYREKFEGAAADSVVSRYCASRGISEETGRVLNLGFAPSGEGVLPFLVGRGFTADECTEAGLVIERSPGDYRERFFNRLLFPIRDTMGRTVGFGGRILGEGEPKYLNSPESQIFRKRSLLYGIDITRKAAREKGKLVIVEGYMDFLAAFQAGVTNVAATLGTAMAEGQVGLIKRYVGEAVLNFDADSAGMDAADRAVKLLLTADVRVRVALIPEGKDPDDYIRDNGPEAYKKLLDEAPTFFDFLLEREIALHDLSDATGKRAFIDGFTPYLRIVADPIERQEYAKELASRTGVKLDLILDRIKRGPAPGMSKSALTKAPEIPVREQVIVQGVLNFPEEAGRLLERLPEDVFSSLVTSGILRSLLKGESVEEPEQTRIMALIENGCHNAPSERDLENAIAEILASHLKDRDREIQRQIKDASLRKDFELVKILSREKLSLLMELKSLEQTGLS